MKRIRNLFDPASSKPYKLSRSRLERFIECPRCFYLDRRMGIDRPSMPGFTLNVAVDHLLKKEFDVYRTKGEPHPLMKKHGVEAVPFRHPDLDIWRANFKGITHLHKSTNLMITGKTVSKFRAPVILFTSTRKKIVHHSMVIFISISIFLPA